MSVFAHKTYKSFLTDYIEKLPKQGRGELARIATHLSVSSALVSQVISGGKNFTLEQAEGVAAYLGLTSLEVDYFLLLVNGERAGTLSLKNYYRQKARELREQALELSQRLEPKKILSEQDYATFYSSHLYASVWLFTSVGEEGKSIDEISRRFDIDRLKTLKIVKFLTEVELCRELKGRYAMGPQSVHIGQNSPHLLHHYRNWRIQAIQQSEALSANELMYSAAVSLSRSDFEKLREQMVLFIQDVLKQTHASPAEDLACFNLDFFWIKK